MPTAASGLRGVSGTLCTYIESSARTHHSGRGGWRDRVRPVRLTWTRAVVLALVGELAGGSDGLHLPWGRARKSVESARSCPLATRHTAARARRSSPTAARVDLRWSPAGRVLVLTVCPCGCARPTNHGSQRNPPLRSCSSPTWVSAAWLAARFLPAHQMAVLAMSSKDRHVPRSGMVRLCGVAAQRAVAALFGSTTESGNGRSAGPTPATIVASAHTHIHTHALALALALALGKRR